jgi:tetratricopeptide (TPR) repeat protein
MGSQEAIRAMNNNGSQASFFRRYVPPDPKGLDVEIASRREQLARERLTANEAAQLEHSIALGFALFVSGNELEAAPLLDEALAIARRRNDRKSEIEALLGLGTARQYLGARELAQRLFNEGLILCESSGLHEQEHFLLHHQGRCYVEQGRISEARPCFEKALELRKALGDQRLIDSSRMALADIAAYHLGEL